MGQGPCELLHTLLVFLYGMMAGLQEKVSQDNLSEVNGLFCDLAFSHITSFPPNSIVKAARSPSRFQEQETRVPLLDEEVAKF